MKALYSPHFKKNTPRKDESGHFALWWLTFPDMNGLLLAADKLPLTY